MNRNTTTPSPSGVSFSLPTPSSAASMSIEGSAMDGFETSSQNSHHNRNTQKEVDIAVKDLKQQLNTSTLTLKKSKSLIGVLRSEKKALKEKVAEMERKVRRNRKSVALKVRRESIDCYAKS